MKGKRMICIDNLRTASRLAVPLVLVTLLMITSAVLAPAGADWDLHSVDASLAGAKSVFAADMNDDDVPDMVAVGSTNHEVFWYEAPLWTKHTIDDSLGGAQDVYVAYVNGDTIPDVVATGLSADDVGQERLRFIVAVQNTSFAALFIVDDELQCETSTARPTSGWRVAAVTQ